MGIIVGMTEDRRVTNEILHMKIRLFRLACKQWGKSIDDCAGIFEKYKIDSYIEDLYEIMHVQGDEANLMEIEEYLEAQGATDDIK